MLPTSTFETEKPRPKATIDASSSDLRFRGEEAQNIFRAFKTLIVLHILTKGEKIKIPQGIRKKSASNT